MVNKKAISREDRRGVAFSIFTISFVLCFLFSRDVSALETLKKTYYKDGTLKTVYTYQNGKKNGIAKTYFRDGALKNKVKYKNGKIDGLANKYYEDGTLHQEVFFKNGKPHGLGRVYNRAGYLDAEFEYDRGEIVEGTIYEYDENEESYFASSRQESFDNKDNMSVMYLRHPGWKMIPQEAEGYVTTEEDIEAEEDYIVEEEWMSPDVYLRSPDWKEKEEYEEGYEEGYEKDASLGEDDIAEEGAEIVMVEEEEDSVPDVYLRSPDWEEEVVVEEEYIVEEEEIIAKEEIVAEEESVSEEEEDISEAVYLRSPDWEKEEIVSEDVGEEDEDIVEESDDTQEAYDEDDYVLEEEEYPGRLKEFLSNLTFEIGTESSYVVYNEPDVMRQRGQMAGVNVGVTYRDPEGDFAEGWIDMVKLDIRFSYGRYDYQGALSDGTAYNAYDFPDYIFDGRLLAGHDFPVLDMSNVMLYTGLGYRYLNDNMRRVSASGYEREQTYVYWPFGVEFTTPIIEKWWLGVTTEFDGLLAGWNVSHTSNVNSGFNNLEFEQTGGWGWRGSFRLQRKGKKLDFSLEPFYRYWKIKASDVQTQTFNGLFYSYAVEPRNNSSEWGLKILVGF